MIYISRGLNCLLIKHSTPPADWYLFRIWQISEENTTNKTFCIIPFENYIKWLMFNVMLKTEKETEWFVVCVVLVSAQVNCLLDHLLPRLPIQLSHFGLSLIISSVVCQGRRFAFSPGPLKNWVTPIISPCWLCCRLTTFWFHNPHWVQLSTLDTHGGCKTSGRDSFCACTCWCMLVKACGTPNLRNKQIDSRCYREYVLIKCRQKHQHTTRWHGINKNIATDGLRCKLGTEGHPGQAASWSHCFTMLPSCGENTVIPSTCINWHWTATSETAFAWHV